MSRLPRVEDCGRAGVERLCCQTPFVLPGEDSGAGAVNIEPLLPEEILRERMGSLVAGRLQAIRDLVRVEVTAPVEGLCLIGSFTYDPFGWDDVDVVALTGMEQPVLEVMHECRPRGGSDPLRIDLITLSRGAVEDGERLGEETFPVFLDSRGNPYEKLCARRRCMAGSLVLMLHFGVWLETPPWANPRRYVTPRRAALCATRLWNEAWSYLADPGDALKGLRRLYLAAELLRRFDQRISGSALGPLLRTGAASSAAELWQALYSGGAVAAEVSSLMKRVEDRGRKLLDTGTSHRPASLPSEEPMASC